MKAIMTILVYWSAGSGAMATTAIEYDNIQVCERAKLAVVQALTVEQRRAVAVCTSKG